MDTSILNYSPSFDPNPGWSRLYAGGAEFLAYSRGIADRHDVRRHIRFNSHVTEATYDVDTSTWRVVLAHSPRKRAGQSSVPQIDADAPKVVWALDFQFDSTVDGLAVKIASMVDEHTRESLLHLAERSITAERLVTELERVFARTGGPPKVLRMDNGPELISDALQQFCLDRVGMAYIPPGTPWNNGYIESFNRRLRHECLNRNHWTSLLEARVVIGDFKTDHNHRHRHSALGYLTPAEHSARCSHTHHPVACSIN